ncbi:hypothetical protein HWB05_gp009 [Streptomyces phage BRock]|uniref:Uncharacterized protein n=1 Tax=Streptomyces phage BRock TaxID=1913591 RepID=A0A1J0GVQ9_9CAUD|nr:hypothetical protein HWB05_gp009 [Streptomyces phage BRock]APC46271.1 hypothetical protein [Streptomyces phage BRock]
MTTAEIAGLVWEIDTLANGAKLYTNTTDNITGVLYWENSTVNYHVVMVDDETSPREFYDNAPYASWSKSHHADALRSLSEVMGDVEEELKEDALDSYYSSGADYDDGDYGYDSYDPYDVEYDRY